jgi:hypothetical protein
MQQDSKIAVDINRAATSAQLSLANLIQQALGAEQAAIAMQARIAELEKENAALKTELPVS